ncbi:MAG: class I SAM-dependent methyltransferase [Rhodospirillales bacterium]|nr:class I SAM-dependent methyltransferase [Rhodospirillales bacterium]
MSFYARRILPHLVNLAMRHPTFTRLRAPVIAGAAGRVLEIGVGSGLNLAFYGPDASAVLGIDPSAELLAIARARAGRSAVPVSLLEGSAELLPLEAASIDTVVTTWTLCTIPDAARALAEVRRVLRRSGRLLFIEHGRSPDARIARWQDRLDPLWGRLAGGCHLNRPIDALIAGNGFAIEVLRHRRLPGPPTHTFLSEGIATPR